ncbi:4-hydroxy-tetrahydrodipicolinate reductase [Blastochloris viridis]|uniref:4-hydroxy-tetrahydrodipicolinate reductase n=1 Tax=Blastochloris viridis TaxID=1079 RepID=A0A0H5BAR9_BLAVI|nr:4-hydroxy-tetrahydrodipicolinate reductase [Blastochloris viridis]ALK10694.1 4-hydroxy-tetrahydrodipicolinate reductase [Blastochloris viridis]BAR99342.1 4-hydroxy-tetrahydrodipicolinate reductase [Blastochloris viridis]CUU43357.1 Dihydrodipicolinate reductase [Blastochloris viridis]
MADLRLVVVGAGGRMGRALVRAISEARGVMLVGAIERAGAPTLGRDAGVLAGLPALGVPVLDDPAAAFAKADGVLDFTTPAVSLAYAALAAKSGLVHVIGTTGFSAEEAAQLEPASRSAVLVKSGNMSLGVNLLAALVKRAAATLGPEFDIEIVEMHHRMKVDAPSGTALLLGEAAAAGRGTALNDHAARGRDGMTGARREGDIGFASLRGGTVVGDHDVVFAGPFERIVLGHKAEDRMIFARGALKAAQWGFGKAPGLYSMADVLGLTDI